MCCSNKPRCTSCSRREPRHYRWCQMHSRAAKLPQQQSGTISSIPTVYAAPRVSDDNKLDVRQMQQSVEQAAPPTYYQATDGQSQPQQLQYAVKT